ncbi:MAG: phage protease [Gammaproteobacteria bacterium]
MITARIHLIALAGQENAAPAWVELLPAGPEIQGRDGRAFKLNDPAALIEAFKRRAIDLPIDWEHASEHRAPQGLEAPAAGWIKALEVRAGALWGQVEWTARAAEQILTRAYRYLSPVFLYDKASQQIVELLSAGLTNQPNLHLTALNQAQNNEVNTMPAAILQALGLADTADEAAVLAAIQQLKAAVDTAMSAKAQAEQRAQQPPLDKFVPKADYEQMAQRAAQAEQKVREIEKAQLAAQVETAIQQALEAKKIAPTSVAYYKAQCVSGESLAAFQQFVAQTPAIVADSGLGDKKPPAADGKALDETAKTVCRALGLSEDEYRKAMA